MRVLQRMTPRPPTEDSANSADFGPNSNAYVLSGLAEFTEVRALSLQRLQIAALFELCALRPPVAATHHGALRECVQHFFIANDLQQQ